MSIQTEDAIYFFRENETFGFLSNFYPSSFEESLNYPDNIEDRHLSFNCTEQYFMYRKLMTFDHKNMVLLREIMHETDPKKIKSSGRKVKNFNQYIWDQNKFEIMYDGLKLKFSQNKDLLQQLIDTGDKTLYEASPYDKIWGIGFDAKRAIGADKNYFGQNLLGKCLMKIRNDLKKKRKL